MAKSWVCRIIKWSFEWLYIKSGKKEDQTIMRLGRVDSRKLTNLPRTLRLMLPRRRSAPLRSWHQISGRNHVCVCVWVDFLNTYWKTKSAQCSSKSVSVVAAVSRVREVRRSTAHIICWINTYQIMWNINLQKDTVRLKKKWKAQHGLSSQFIYLHI